MSEVSTINGIRRYTKQLLEKSKKTHKKTLEDRIESLFNVLYGSPEDEDYFKEIDFEEFIIPPAAPLPKKRPVNIMPMRKSQRPRRSMIR